MTSQAKPTLAVSKLDELVHAAIDGCAHTRSPECPGERVGACEPCIRAAILVYGEAVRERAAKTAFDALERNSEYMAACGVGNEIHAINLEEI